VNSNERKDLTSHVRGRWFESSIARLKERLLQEKRKWKKAGARSRPLVGQYYTNAALSDSVAFAW
jgi:hypothetical protein